MTTDYEYSFFSYLLPDEVWQHLIYHIDKRILAIYFVLTFILIHYLFIVNVDF